MLDWPLAVAYGAVGGVVVEAIELWRRMIAWQAARRSARVAALPAPPFATVMDPLPDIAVAVTRVGLGALAGFVFHTGVSGISAAMAVGAAGPALLTQFGSAVTAAASARAERQTDSSEPM